MNDCECYGPTLISCAASAILEPSSSLDKEGPPDLGTCTCYVHLFAGEDEKETKRTPAIH